MRLEFEACTSSELGGDELDRLVAGDLCAVLVKGLWSSEEVSEIVDAIERGDLGMAPDRRDHADAKVPQVETYGMPISPSRMHPGGPDPAAYAAQSEQLAQRLPGLFSRSRGFIETLETTFERAGRTAQRAPGYAPCTVRRVPAGCAMELHSENRYVDIEVLRPLHSHLQMLECCSFFLTLATCAGGGLRVYGQKWDDPAGRDGAAKSPQITIETQPGDLIFFAAGRHFHEVETVHGGSRWTLGGFFAPRTDGGGVEYWG